jgi:hypothetical protein
MGLINFIVLFGLGFLLVKYREKVQRFTGDIGLAEKYFGAGGTFTFYLLVGVFMMVLAILMVTGATEGITNIVKKFLLIPGK